MNTVRVGGCITHTHLLVDVNLLQLTDLLEPSDLTLLGDLPESELSASRGHRFDDARQVVTDQHEARLVAVHLH